MSNFTVYLAVEPHQGTIQVPYLTDSSSKEDLENVVCMSSEMGGNEPNLRQ